MSSHQWLYPIFHCRGYRVTKVQTDEHRLLLYVEPQPHKSERRSYAQTNLNYLESLRAGARDWGCR